LGDFPEPESPYQQILGMEGYIKLHRKLLENPLCNRLDYLGLWAHLLLRANHKEAELMSDIGIIKLKPGQFITSRDKLGKELSANPSKIERMLKRLEIGQQIKQEANSRFRIITIVNWNKYQQTEQLPNSRTDNKRTAGEQLANTNNNDKNDKNDKKELATKVADPINQLIELFKPINPSYKQFYANTTQRNCLARILKELGQDELREAIKVLPQTNSMPFAPVITTPYELEKKIGALKAFIQKEGNRINTNRVVII